MKVIQNLFVIIVVFSLQNIQISYAQSQDLYINSDKLVVDQKNNNAIFTGAVTLWFKNMMLNTNYLEVIYEDKKLAGANNIAKTNYLSNSSERTIKEIIIPYHLMLKNFDNNQVAIADYGHYFYREGKLVLSGNVKLEYQEKFINTKELVYYTQLKKNN